MIDKLDSPPPTFPPAPASAPPAPASAPAAAAASASAPRGAIFLSDCIVAIIFLISP